MTEDPGTDQQPPKPDQQPPRDDIRWLIYLAIGFVVVLALLLLSGLQSSHGPLTGPLQHLATPRPGTPGPGRRWRHLPAGRGREHPRGHCVA
jgi:hypothetical protein